MTDPLSAETVVHIIFTECKLLNFIKYLCIIYQIEVSEKTFMYVGCKFLCDFLLLFPMMHILGAKGLMWINVETALAKLFFWFCVADKTWV